MTSERQEVLALLNDLYADERPVPESDAEEFIALLDRARREERERIKGIVREVGDVRVAGWCPESPFEAQHQTAEEILRRIEGE